MAGAGHSGGVQEDDVVPSAPPLDLMDQVGGYESTSFDAGESGEFFESVTLPVDNWRRCQISSFVPSLLAICPASKRLIGAEADWPCPQSHSSVSPFLNFLKKKKPFFKIFFYFFKFFF